MAETLVTRCLSYKTFSHNEVKMCQNDAGDSKNVEEQNSTFKGRPRVDHTPSNTWLRLANTFQKLLDLF